MASFSFLKSTMLCLVLLFSLLFSVQPAQAIVTSVDEETGAAYASGQLIVKYKNWGSKNTSIFTAEGGTVLE